MKFRGRWPWLVGLFAVAAVAVPTVVLSQNTGVNPTVGSVWTYLGATFGAGWAPLPPPVPGPMGPAGPPGGIISVPSYGADPTGIADSGPAFQAACDANPGRTIYVPVGKYAIKTAVTINKLCYFLGDGYKEYNNAGGSTCPAYPVSGTWIYMPQSASTVKPFTISGDGNAGRVGFGNMAFCQDQPTPAPGWAPRVYPAVVTISGTSGEASFNDLFWYNIYQAIDASATVTANGRLNFTHNSGQILFNFLTMDKGMDASRGSDFHFWPFWSQDVNVNLYTISNAVLFRMLRTDGFQIGSLFGFGYAACIKTETSADGSSTTAMMIANYYCDDTQVGVWATGNGSHLHFGNFFSAGNPPSGNPFSATTGGMAMLVTSQGSQFSIANFRAVYIGTSAIRLSGLNNLVQIGSAVTFETNQDVGSEPLYYAEPSNSVRIANRPLANTLHGAQVSGGGGRFDIPWTQGYVPTILGSTAPGTPTYAIANGTYQVTGDQISVSFNVGLVNMTGATGNAIIGGFPYPASPSATNASGDCFISNVSNILFPAGFTQISGEVHPGTNTIDLLQTNPTTGQTTFLPISALGTSGRVKGNCTYFSSG